MGTSGSGRKKSVNIIVRIIKAPIRAISKTLDLYVRGVTGFSNAYNRPLRTGVEVTPESQLLPRSFTTSRLYDNDQQLEGALVRSISAGAVAGEASKINNFELYMIQQRCRQLQSSASGKYAPKSPCAGMRKIDEDRVSSFRDDNIIITSNLCVKDKHSLFSKGTSDDLVPSKRNSW